MPGVFKLPVIKFSIIQNRIMLIKIHLKYPEGKTIFKFLKNKVINIASVITYKLLLSGPDKWSFNKT
jgi:hypothetical protein